MNASTPDFLDSLPEAFVANERKARVAVAALNQLAHDYSGNAERMIRSINEAKEQNAKLWVGPELATTGYSCDDGFNEQDTVFMSWGVIKNILTSGATDGVLSVIGAPVLHNGVRYNCNVWILNGTILGIRPKKSLADDGQYREDRWFTAWRKMGEAEEFRLPDFIAQTCGKQKVPIGDFQIETTDGTVLDSEMCEEMFTADRPSGHSALSGTEIEVNTSGSHWEIGKLQGRIRRMLVGTINAGGIYIYSNLVGADGSTLLFDGAPVIVQNGKVLAVGEQFTMKDVQTITATVDLSSTTRNRGLVQSFGSQAAGTKLTPRISAPIQLTEASMSLAPSVSITPEFPCAEQEVLDGTSLWMWDYLRRSGAQGLFLPLSGGADSGAVACMVAHMCSRLLHEIRQGHTAVLEDLRRITRNPEFMPSSSQEIADLIFYTAYMKNSGTSGSATENRSAALAGEIGSYHLNAPITDTFTAARASLESVLSRTLLFESEGGSPADDLAIQNLQARLRKDQSYAIAQLAYRTRFGKDGWLLVLGAGNADEQLVGYATKYDAGSGDLNPIGSIGKERVKTTLRYAGKTLGFQTPAQILDAAPTAELRPASASGVEQTDEADIGLTYPEINIIGSLHLQQHLGPVSLFQHLAREWGPKSTRAMSVREVATKVKTYFRKFRLSRHKAWVLTPAVHAAPGNPDVHRNDLRPLFAPIGCKDEFEVIDALVEQLEAVSVS